MPSVVVVGIPKSGTSALYAAIKSDGDWLTIFECGNARQFAYLLEHPAPRKLVKILLARPEELGLDLAACDRQVLITRDPRDLVISWLLYRPFMHGLHRNSRFMDEFCDTLRRKEADPHSTSIGELTEVFTRHGIGHWEPPRFRRAFAAQQRQLDRVPGMHRLRYEDFLDGHLAATEDYLGVALTGDARLGEHVGYNERAKAHGGWRHWFTGDDVARYRPHFDAHLARYGYDLDWEPATDPHIDPATSSEHVAGHARALADRPPSTGRLLDPGSYTPARMAMLSSAVADGREGAMIELALAAHRGFGRPRDDAAALALLDEAAARGNPTAMVHRGLGARHRVTGFGDDPAGHLAAASELRGGRRVRAMVAELDAVWADAGRRPAPRPQVRTGGP